MTPIGSPVTPACESGLFDKGFQHQRTIPITLQPILRQLLSDQP
jgi:hypothetical protein